MTGPKEYYIQVQIEEHDTGTGDYRNFEEVKVATFHTKEEAESFIRMMQHIETLIKG